MESSRGLTDATTKPFRGPWEGDDKIVIGVDIGTTQSGVAFAFLQSGASQTIHRVTRWPGQEAQNQQGKIPTLVWYDSNKKAVSFGAEALSPLAEEQAEDHHWTLARNFKLHLHPDDMKEKHGLKLEKLPPGVSLDQIYTDFLGYLLEHTRSYFEDRILDGRRIWEQYKSSMDLIIAHPNGWAIREQSFLRAAVVNAGFVDIAGAATKVRFVSEAEASVHFCIYHTNIGSRLQAGSNFAVCDAGGSTVDTTLYSVGSARPTLELKEQRGSACVQAGAIFVDMAAEAYLRKTLVTAGLGESETEEFSKVGVKDFEAFAKRTFGDDIKEYSIAIAHSRFNNPSIKTRRGRMSVPGFAIKSFFETCTTEIIASVDQQVRGLNVSHILLVGGFGDSPFLRDGFKKRYEPQGCQVTLTNDSTSKAVADGAVIWGTISSVVSRAPRSSFGVITLTRYSPHVPEQQGRTLTLLADGYQWVDGGWSPVVSKDIPLDVQAVSRQTFSRFYSGPNPQLSVFEVRLLSYGGEGQPPWALNAQGGLVTGFRYVCVIKANLSNLSGALKRRAGHSRKAYWHLTFDVCIRFGGTELEVYLEWEEHGATRTGPVTVVPENTV